MAGGGETIIQFATRRGVKFAALAGNILWLACGLADCDPLSLASKVGRPGCLPYCDGSNTPYQCGGHLFRLAIGKSLVQIRPTMWW